MDTTRRRQLLKIVLIIVGIIGMSLPVSAQQTWSTWTKWPEPVFSGQYVASDPALIDEGDSYRMFYTCFIVPESGFVPELVRAAICEATSTDGLTWEEVSDGPTRGLIMPGREGEWNENLEAAFAIKWQGRYLLYYSGYDHIGDPALGFPAALAVAESFDGVNFTPVSDDPIMMPTPGWFDNDAVYSPTIVESDGQLMMIYAGHCYTNCQYGYGNALLGATSEDGITWTKLDEPVLAGNIAGAEWTRDGVAEPGLVQGPDGRWYLFFTGLKDEERLIGQAVGPTPFGPWEIDPEPLFLPDPAGFDSVGDLAPFVFIEGDVVRMWFLGMTPEEKIAIGYAEAPWPLIR